MKQLFLLLIIFFILSSCDKNDRYLEEEYRVLSEKLTLPEEPFHYGPAITRGLEEIVPQIQQPMEVNSLRDHQATLGRVLFYDKRLSKTDEVSCATCHQQAKAFAEGTRISTGIEGREGRRNALALAVTLGFDISYGGEEGADSPNSAFFSWDDTVNDLHEQSKKAITNSSEMDLSIEEVIDKLSRDDIYPVLFKRAFGTSEIAEGELLEALRIFMNTLSSGQTRFDKELVNSHGNPFEDFVGFSASENRGKAIFNRDCIFCHSETHAFSVVSSSNNGLDINYTDQGKGAITGNEQDMGVFKVPFLRNISETAPYMHDGRFTTLEQVIEHYSEGIQGHKNLGFALRDEYGLPKKFGYSSREKEDLITYLRTLSDHKILVDERFSDPFK